MPNDFSYSLSDLPTEFRDAAELLGPELTRRLIEFCGGQHLYIPKRESVERTARNRAIRHSYYSGAATGRVLSRRYHLSDRQIQRILYQKDPR